MAVNYTSGELQLSGTVTNAEFYAATSTAGLSRNAENQYVLGANMRILSGADLSGLRNIIISLNTNEIISEDDDLVFDQITFIENDGRAVADRVVFKTNGSGKNPILNDCQFIHNIVGNPGGSDPRYLSMAHIGGASNTVFRASEFSEQEIDGVQLMESGLYRGISGVRVKRFITSTDPSGNMIRVMLKDLKQSSKIYGTGGIIAAYAGSSMMVSNWEKEVLDSGATNNWLDNYNGQLGNHWVYLLGSAASAYQSNGAGISQKKDTLHVVKGGHKYYKFINGEGSTFAYFDSRGTSPQPCVIDYSRADMLNTTALVTVGSDEQVEFVTQSMTYNRDTGSWVETNISNQRFLCRKYGYREVGQDITDVESVEGSPEAYSPFLMSIDDKITETNVATVAAYTGIAVDSTNKTITLTSGTFSLANVYDYCKYWLTQNMGVDSFITAGGAGLDVETSYKVVVDNGATLEITPENESLRFTSDAPLFELTIKSGGEVSLGEETTSDGLTTYSTGMGLVFAREGVIWNQNQANIRIEGGGTLTQNGGDVTLTSPVSLLANSNWYARSGSWYNGRADSSQRLFFRSWATTGVDVTGVELNDMVMGAFRSPSTFDNVKMVRSRMSVVGTSNSGTNTEFHVKNFEALGNTDTDFFNEGSSVVSLYNVSNGTNLKHTVSDADPDVGYFVNTGGSKLYKEVEIHTIDSDRNNIENAIIYLKDTNNGSRRSITSAGGTTEDYTSDQIYKFVTGSDGKTGVQNILTGVFYFVEDATPENVVDRRSNANDGNDIFTMSLVSYNHKYSETQVPLMGLGVADIEMSLVVDDAITETDRSVVAAYTGIAIDHTNKVITLSSGSWDAPKIYDYVKYNKTLSTNVQYPSIDTFAVEYVGGEFVSKYRLVVNSGASIDINTTDGVMAFSNDCPTPCMSGDGIINFGFSTTSNGIVSYDPATLNFNNVGSSWYLDPAYTIDGTVVIDGLMLNVTRPIETTNDATLTVNSGTFKIGSHSLTSPYEINFSSPNITLNDFTIDGRGTFIISDDVVVNKFKGKNFDGIFPSGKFRGAGADFLTINDYEAVGSYNDHTLWRRNRIKWVNNVNGTDIKVNGKETSSNSQHTGISEFWSEVKLHVTDAANVPQIGVRYAAKDYDDGNRTDTSGLTGSPSSGHYNTGFDYTGDRTYTGLTDINGYSPVIPVLIGVVDRSVGGAQVTPASDWSYRGKNGDNTDEFEFYVWQYGRNMATINMSMKGAGEKEGKLVTTTDINISEPDVSVVSAYTGIGINHDTKTITISTQHTLGELYDYMVYDKTTAAGVFKPTLGTKVPTIVGATIDIGDYNLVVDGCDILAGDSGFSLLQTTGLITLQNGATIDFNFLDSIGNAIVAIDVPVNWTLEGIYPSQSDALNQTNKVPNSNVNYKYLTTDDGGNTVWFRVEDGDGTGVGFDAYELPITRGVYGTAAITTTEDSLLNQIRALVRDTKTITEDVQEQTSDALTNETFTDFQKRSGYNLATVEEAVNNRFDNRLSNFVDMGFRQEVGHKCAALVQRKGTAISKVKFYAGQAFNRSTNTYTGGVVQFKIWKAKSSGTTSDGNFGDIVWESPSTYQLDDLTEVQRDGVIGTSYDHVHRTMEFDMDGQGIIMSEDWFFGYEVISGEALVPIDVTNNTDAYKGHYYEHHRLNGWFSNSPGYIIYTSASKPVAVDITEYNYNLITQYELKANIRQLIDDQYTAEVATADKIDIMDTAKRAKYVNVIGCPTEAANGAYRLLSPEEVDVLNTHALDNDLSLADEAVIDRTQPVYGLDNNKWIIAGFVGDYGFKICKLQNNDDYYTCFTNFDPFYLEDNADFVHRDNWKVQNGKYENAAGTDVPDLYVVNTMTMSKLIHDKVDQLRFTDDRVDANVPDQLTETEYDTKSAAIGNKKGWQ